MIFVYSLFFMLSNATAATLEEGLVRPTLQVSGFASCLKQVAGDQDPHQIKKTNSLKASESLNFLVYLAFYPGQAIPGFEKTQAKGLVRWQEGTDEKEARVAESWVQFLHELPANQKAVPAQLFSIALNACGNSDGFCAGLISHNVLRAFGRYQESLRRGQDFNPAWFKAQSQRWIQERALMAKKLVSLRKDSQGDLFGEWYHFFGVFSYTVFKKSVGNMIGIRTAVAMNRVANLFFTGKKEDSEKSQLDQDSIDVAKKFLDPDFNSSSELNCGLRETYVNL